jgi:ABC-2 type transport system ATP-binding protein
MGLDAGYRRLFIDYLTEYAKAENKTIFITSHIIQDLEELLDDCVIIDYRSVLLTMPIKQFLSEFKQYKCDLVETNGKLKKDNVIKNVEVIKNKAALYSFAEMNELGSHLSKLGIKHTGLHQVKMSLEDAFIGLTGKY